MEEQRGKKEEREEQKGRNEALIGRILYLLAELSTTKVEDPVSLSVERGGVTWRAGLGLTRARPSHLMTASSPY